MVRKLSVLAAALLVVAALTASDAFALATTEAKQWYTGSTETGVTTLPVGVPQNVTIEVGEHSSELGKKFTFRTTLGTTNIPLVFTATGVECKSCTLENKVIEGKTVAAGRGITVFTGVTTMEPVGCKVKEEKLTTNPLKIEAHYMEGPKVLKRVLPETGETYVTLTLEAVSSGSCSIGGSYPIKTSKGLYSEAKNLTGVFKKEQAYVFSPAINSAAGGNLFLATSAHPAEVTGTGISKAEGKYFGIK